MIDGNKDLVEFFSRTYARRSRILDIGGGNLAGAIFVDHGNDLFVLDIKSHPPVPGVTQIKGRFPDTKPNIKFDCVWASHILEHAPNVNLFISSMIDCGTDNAAYGIVVPPPGPALAGGHLSSFTAASLCYNVILSGQNLSQATVIIHKYNTAVFWRRSDCVLPDLRMDKGDIETLSHLFPREVYQGINGMVGWDRIRSCGFDDLLASRKTS